MRSRLYYDDGSTADDLLGGPLGVQVIVQDDPEVGRALLHGRDYYILVDGRWMGLDTFGFLDWMLHHHSRVTRAVAGRTLPDAEFTEILQRAQDDPDFPPKSAKRPWER